MSQTTAKKRYKTTNWAQYNASLKARGSLTIWLDKRITWFGAASGKRGRSPKFSDAAIQFCLTLKNLFGLALRQATGLIESVLRLSGLTWPTPDFSTLSRRQQTLNVQIPYARSHAGLHLLVDSTGIKFLGEGEWKCKKHGAQYRRQWRKLHIGIDAKTMQIRAICVTSKSVFAILFAPTIWCVKRQKYASDISREKFAEIEPELRKVRRRTNTDVIVFTGLQIQVCGLWAIYTKFCIPSATHHQIQSP